MPLSTEKVQEIIKTFGKNPQDTGAPEVQIALLTQRIRELTEHVKAHKKDNHSRHGLVKLVSKRKRLLKYVMKTNPASYVELKKELGIRG